MGTGKRDKTIYYIAISATQAFPESYKTNFHE